MTDTLRKLSWFNRLAFLTIAVGSVYLLLKGQWWTASIVGMALPIMGFLVYRSMRGLGSDRNRVDAAQPFDERERQVVTTGFAALGQFAFLAQGAVTIWSWAEPGTRAMSEGLRFLVLSIVLGIANTVAARRA